MVDANRDIEPATGKALIRAFRRHGYEGASLSALSQETGLIKASLYHRFPGGKEQMASAALEAAERHFRTQVLSPLVMDISHRRRLAKMIDRLKDFYADGRLACLLDTLSLQDSPKPVVERARETVKALISALTNFAQSGGLSSAEAKLAAEEALVQIEGSLVLCRVTGETLPFERALRRLPNILLRKKKEHSEKACKVT